MSTLKETVYNAVINIHRNTGKEWISLNDIYEEVLKTKEVKNGEKSIKAALEAQCESSDIFKDKEGNILIVKNSEFYKSVYYDNIKTIINLNIGEIFTKDQLMRLFKISGQSGIMPSAKCNCIVITTSDSNGIYNDSSIENGTIIYTGAGRVGDQKMEGVNKSLYNSKEDNKTVYLFTKDKKRKYTFEGVTEVYDVPYQTKEKDKEGNNRIVWKFPLRIIYPDNYEYEDDERVKNLAYKIKQIETKVDFEDTQNDLVFVDGPINIRKYRKTGRHNNRTRKPDFIAQEIIKNKQGIINEKYIYEMELKRLIREEANQQVKEMEEFFYNKKENEGYDILTFEINENGEYTEKYIEVKSTKGNESTPIDITIDEIEFAKKHIDNYYLYRVINSDSDQRYVKVVKGKDLLNNYNFVPTAFKIYSE